MNTCMGARGRRALVCKVGLTVGGTLHGPQACLSAWIFLHARLPLTQGVIGVNEVRELFNAALANFCQNPVTEPPVMDIKMDSTGELGGSGGGGERRDWPASARTQSLSPRSWISKWTPQVS